MAHSIAFVCPACTEHLLVSELTCPACHTKIQGEFEASPLNHLTPDQLEFVVVFLRSRGNIKEVERELKISYPTVRARLHQVIQAMGYPIPNSDDSADSAEDSEILDSLGRGDLTFEEALRRIKEERQP